VRPDLSAATMMAAKPSRITFGPCLLAAMACWGLWRNIRWLPPLTGLVVAGGLAGDDVQAVVDIDEGAALLE
jgi:hypothetical protein